MQTNSDMDNNISAAQRGIDEENKPRSYYIASRLNDGRLECIRTKLSEVFDFACKGCVVLRETYRDEGLVETSFVGLT